MIEGALPREVVAIHEAGHAAVALALGMRVHGVSIEPVTCDGGTILGILNFDDRAAPVDHVALVWLAGRAAQRHVDGSDLGCGNDISYVRELVRCDAFDALAAESARLVAADWRTVERIASALLRDGSLAGREAHALARSSAPSGRSVQLIRAG